MMVYGRYGRTGIYQIQDLLRMVNAEEDDIEIELENTKEIIAALPASNALVSNSTWFKEFVDKFKTDHINSEFYDLFLHKRDVSYTVADIYRFSRMHELHVTGWEEALVRTNLLIDAHIKDKHFLQQIKKQITQDQETIAELLSGDVGLHAVYASKINNSEADVKQLDNVVFIHGQVRASEASWPI